MLLFLSLRFSAEDTVLAGFWTELALEQDEEGRRFAYQREEDRGAGRLRSTGSQRVGHDLSDLAQQRGNCLQQELGDVFKYISRVLFRESLCFSKSSFGERDFLLIKSLLIFSCDSDV